MITPAQENERMLARLLGVGEDQASEKLDRRVAITHGDGAAVLFGKELAEQLGRTIHIGGGGACDLEVVVNARPATPVKERLFITLDESFISVSATPVPPSGSNVELHGLRTVIGACYTAGTVLARLVDGIEPAPKVDPFVIRFDALGANRRLLQRAISLNNAVLVGAGAVGNGFLRGARHLRIGGALAVADPKVERRVLLYRPPGAAAVSRNNRAPDPPPAFDQLSECALERSATVIPTVASILMKTMWTGLKRPGFVKRRSRIFLIFGWIRSARCVDNRRERNHCPFASPADFRSVPRLYLPAYP